MAAARNNIHDYSPDAADELFSRNSFRYSVICILAVLLTAVIASVIITNVTDIFLLDFIVFSEDDSTVTVFSKMSDGITGERVKLRIDDCVFENGNVTVKLYGENSSGRELKINGSTFMLSSFNSHAAETRDHYYPDNFEPFTVHDGETFETTLQYSMYGLEINDPDSFIFMLSAFRGSKLPTLEIILNE